MRRPLAMAAVFALVACMLFALCGCTGEYDPDASMKEQAIDASALKDGETLHVGVDASSYPMAGESKGRMSGLNVDIAAAIAQELGVKVEFVDVGMDGIEALSGDEVDMVMGIETADAKDQCWASDAYGPSGITLFSMDAGAALPKKSDDLTISAQTASMSAWLAGNIYGEGSVMAEDDLRDAFQDLSDGNAQYAAADAIVGAYIVNKTGIDAHMVGLLQKADGYCIGVEEDNEALQQAVTQALSTIEGNGVLDVIMLRWTGGPVDVSDLAVADAKSASSDSSKKSDEAKQAISDNAGSGDTGTVGANAVSVG